MSLDLLLFEMTMLLPLLDSVCYHLLVRPNARDHGGRYLTRRPPFATVEQGHGLDAVDGV